MRFRQSYAKTLLEYCPAVLKKRIDSERRQTKAMAAGSLVDYVLFGRTDRFEVVDARYKTGKRQGMPAEDWQCGEAQEQADLIRARGLLPVLECELEAAEDEAAPVRRKLDAMSRERGGMLLEQPKMTWTSELGVECEGTPDVVLLEHVQGTTWVTVIDIKRTDQRMNKLARQVHAMGWDVQAAAYREGALYNERLSRNVGGDADVVYRGHIILSVDPAGETEPCARPLEPMYLEIGRRRWERAQTIWNQCLDTDSWPGYEEKPIAAPFYIERSEMERREYYTLTEADEEP
jgi:hypothetical protein